jgi:hypothetical protein
MIERGLAIVLGDRLSLDGLFEQFGAHSAGFKG